MHKYKFLSLALLLSLAGTVSLHAATESKNLQNPSPALAPVEPTAPQSNDDSLANEAGQEFSDGAKGLGRGFVKGAKVTGGAFKKAGNTMGRGFKRAGLAIRNYFMGTSEVEERDIGKEASESYEYEAAPLQPSAPSHELDSIGNAPPKKSEQGRVSREASSNDSAFN